MKYFYIMLSIVAVVLLGFILFFQVKNNHESLSVQEQKEFLKQKGYEHYSAVVKSTLSNIRAEAELIYDKNRSYQDLCKNGVVNTNYSKITGIDYLVSLARVEDQLSAGLSCVSSASKYAVSFVSKSKDIFEYLNFCVDNSGYAEAGVTNSQTISCGRLILN